MKTGLMIVVAIVVGFIAGYGICHQAPLDEEKVRVALYEACVNSTNYKPESDNLSGGFVCNRRSIENMLAHVYDSTYIPPLPDAETRAKYESALEKYKHKN